MSADAWTAAPSVLLKAAAQCLVNSICRFALAQLGLDKYAINKLAEVSLQNSESDELVIELYPKVGNYIDVAKSRGASYFNMPADIWNIVKNTNVAWEINEQAMQMTADEGKTVILQTDFAQGMSDPSRNFFRELWFFVSQGYDLIDDKLVPTDHTGFGFP